MRAHAPVDLDELLARLRPQIGDPATAEQLLDAIQELREWRARAAAGRRGAEIGRGVAIAKADEAMVAQKLPRAARVRALRERWGMSRAAAYRRTASHRGETDSA